MSFKIGDVVRFKSGGPKMTVNNVVGETTSQLEQMAYTNAGHKDGDLVCKWFKNESLESGVFKPETVELDSGE